MLPSPHPPPPCLVLDIGKDHVSIDVEGVDLLKIVVTMGVVEERLAIDINLESVVAAAD